MDFRDADPDMLWAKNSVQRLHGSFMNAEFEKLEAPRSAVEMTGVPRPELDARLETIEARMDARVAGMSAKLDATLAEIRADRARFTHLESDIRDVKTGMAAISTNVDNKLVATAAHTDAQIRGLKANIWFGVATTIAAIGATLAIAIASFDSGRETSKSISEATARMEKISSQLDAAARAQATQAPPAKP